MHFKMAMAAAAVGAALTVVVSGCGGSGSTAAKPAAAVTSASTPGGTASTSSAAPLTASSSPAATPFTVGQLTNALLPASAFGADVTAIDGYPKGRNELSGSATLSGEGCSTVTLIGPESGSIVGATTLAQSPPTGTEFVFVIEKASQFPVGAAQTMMRHLAERLGAGGDCASFNYTTSQGTTQKITVKEQAVTGLGDEAISYESTKAEPDFTIYAKAVVVRYGDIAISLSYETGDMAKTKSFDLAAQAKHIAANLDLH